MEKVKTSTLKGVWKNLMSALMDHFEGCETSGEEANKDVAEITKT